MSIQAGWNSTIYQAGMLYKMHNVEKKAGGIEERLPEPKRKYEAPTVEISENLTPDDIARVQQEVQQETVGRDVQGLRRTLALSRAEGEDERAPVGAVDAEGNPIEGNRETTFGQELRNRMVDYEEQALAQGASQYDVNRLSRRVLQGNQPTMTHDHGTDQYGNSRVSVQQLTWDEAVRRAAARAAEANARPGSNVSDAEDALRRMQGGNQ